MVILTHLCKQALLMHDTTCFIHRVLTTISLVSELGVGDEPETPDL
jgi:hypothetical protein